MIQDDVHDGVDVGNRHLTVKIHIRLATRASTLGRSTLFMVLSFFLVQDLIHGDGFHRGEARHRKQISPFFGPIHDPIYLMDTCRQPFDFIGYVIGCAR